MWPADRDNVFSVIFELRIPRRFCIVVQMILKSSASMRSVLLNILSSRQKSDSGPVFIVGSPLSRGPKQRSAGVPTEMVGVPTTKEMVGICREVCERQGLDLTKFDRATSHASAADNYQAAFEFIENNAGHAAKAIHEVVRTAVRSAYKGTEDDDRRAEADHENWELPVGTVALAKILVDPTKDARTVITTNYDPLLKIAIQRVGGRVQTRIMGLDGTLPTTGEAMSGAVQIIYLHGYWTGITYHSVIQLEQKRNYLEAGLFDMLRDRTLVAIAYGGWHDSFTRALARLSPHLRQDTNIVWSFYGSDEDSVSDEHSELLDSVSDLSFRTHFRMYGGVDCHSFLPEIVDAMKSAS